MNKRQRKKLGKQRLRDANVPKGYGLIIGTRWESIENYHCFKIGSIVKILGRANGDYSCKHDGLHQYVPDSNIIVNLGGKSL